MRSMKGAALQKYFSCNVLEQVKNVDIDAFVSGLRKEIGNPDELTQNLWYVYSPMGQGKTKEGKKHAYYGERVTCTRCAKFSWDLSVSAPCVDQAALCLDCAFAMRDVRRVHYLSTSTSSLLIEGKA
jgi:hypothetical protein